MNLQQLKYIVALNRFRNFARAAEACQISQPTLSAMLVKLEYENMWIMKEALCLRNNAFSFCKARSKGHDGRRHQEIRHQAVGLDSQKPRCVSHQGFKMILFVMKYNHSG